MTSTVNTGGVGVSAISIHDLIMQGTVAVDQAIDMFGGDGEIYSCIISQTASIDTGIRVNGGPWRIHDNQVFTDDTGILLLSGSKRCIVANNVLGTGFKADGILIEGNDNIIIGNFVDGGTIRVTGDDNHIIGNIFRSLNSADNGFIIAGDRNFIEGNKVIDDFGTSPAVGIQILSGAIDNIIGANDLSQAVLPITDAGTGTIFKGTRTPAWAVVGTLATGIGVSRMRIPEDGFIIDAAAVVDTAPTGASIIVDVHKNGTTIFTTPANRPTIAVAAFDSGLAIPDVTAVAAGDVLTVDIDQIGSIIAGADLTVFVRYVNVGVTG